MAPSLLLCIYFSFTCHNSNKITTCCYTMNTSRLVQAIIGKFHVLVCVACQNSRILSVFLCITLCTINTTQYMSLALKGATFQTNSAPPWSQWDGSMISMGTKASTSHIINISHKAKVIMWCAAFRTHGDHIAISLWTS